MGNVQASTIGAAQRVHDRNVAARGLSEEFAYQGNYWAEDFSFFFFERSSETSVWHYSSDVPYRECDEIQSRLKARFLTGENRGHSLSWNCILVEERYNTILTKAILLRHGLPVTVFFLHFWMWF